MEPIRIVEYNDKLIIQYRFYGAMNTRTIPNAKYTVQDRDNIGLVVIPDNSKMVFCAPLSDIIYERYNCNESDVVTTVTTENIHTP